MKLTDITEAKPTKTMDPTELNWDTMFDEPISKGELTTPSAEKSKEKTKEVPQLKKATAADTAKALKGASPTDAMRDMIGKLNVPDDALAAEPDVEMPTTVAADNVPAVISTALKKMGSEVGDQTSINPDFHQVKNLPGYLSKPIRVMGRETFKPYTTTPIEDISVIADLMGQGPNTPRDVQGVAKWLATNAQEVDRATMDYGSSMPGYEANTISYSTAGIRFMVVKDFAGFYIYAWPESDSVKQVGNEPVKKIA